jgi:hypothetical protein
MIKVVLEGGFSVRYNCLLPSDPYKCCKLPNIRDEWEKDTKYSVNWDLHNDTCIYNCILLERH